LYDRYEFISYFPVPAEACELVENLFEGAIRALFKFVEGAVCYDPAFIYKYYPACFTSGQAMRLRTERSIYQTCL
jgi:hypothetical protein